MSGRTQLQSDLRSFQLSIMLVAALARQISNLAGGANERRQK